MFSTIFAVLPFALLALADGNGQCATGTLSCCDNHLSAHDAQGPLGQLGLGDLLNGVTGNVGVNCNPITVIGTGQGATCTNEPVCCDHNNYNGLLNLGCSPVNVAA
ncbi:fungal hydrophobin [Coniophora puteana RWD-64-598 SS2]|uniref:Hydrophobin n=1 Tax=Coniophora puteana (strain RWD-64-598) TaxID=741705 RepID=A0A5M3MDN9_CONPW|nr:fungal hydrophobin [Coniophora puteana RWD-64-598 SS2]EIW77382.1 fungal hydrophobin [Coniophora puteana RWD-64-598 SS2]